VLCSQGNPNKRRGNYGEDSCSHCKASNRECRRSQAAAHLFRRIVLAIVFRRLCATSRPSIAILSVIVVAALIVSLTRGIIRGSTMSEVKCLTRAHRRILLCVDPG
jgi:hypothetical protein